MSDVDVPSGAQQIVEVELTLTDDRYPLVALPDAEDCRLVLEKLLPRDGERDAQYYSVVGANPEDVREYLRSLESIESRLLVSYESGGLFELLVSDNCPICDLVKRGAVPTSVTGTERGGEIVAEIFPKDDPATVVDAFLERYAADLEAKRRKADATPLLGEPEIRSSVLDRLTDRQREVLFAAFEAGYYDRPRETTGAELAQELGITSTTFQQHLRAAERKLVAFLAETRTE